MDNEKHVILSQSYKAMNLLNAHSTQLLLEADIALISLGNVKIQLFYLQLQGK